MPKKVEKSEAKPTAHRYSAADITVLEGLDPVRKRPGMYIGTTGPDGLHHLIWEVFDNARDEAMGGFANDVEVALLPGNRVRVVDNGRGIPIDKHKQSKVSALETIMTTLHAGGKFGGEGYKVSGGLHGVGVSVVNALSVYAKAEVHREGSLYVQEYSRGKKKAAVKKLGSTKHTGTIITFEPDTEIFSAGGGSASGGKDWVAPFDWNKIVSHLRGQAYLVKGLRITVIDARDYDGKLDFSDTTYLREKHLEVPSMTFCFEGGLLSLVRFYNQHQKPIHKNIFYVERDAEGVAVELSLQYVDDISARIMAYANNTYNSEGGTHITGFKTALTRTLNNYAKKNNLIKNGDESFTGDDVLEGLTVVISVKLPEIQFEGQTKAKLGSVEARGAVDTVFSDAFASFLEEHPDDARAIIGKVTLALKARKAAKAAKESVLRKGALEGMTLPGKLADCQSRNAAESELFIVEGDSAGGCFSGDTKIALTDGRDLPLKEIVKEYAQGRRHYCYTIANDGAVAVGEVRHPRITKRNAGVLKVVLDNDEEITCTPDHKFMLRDGSYREAQQLKKNDSLMPLYRKHSKVGGHITIDGYEMVLDPSSDRWIFTHLLSDRYNIKRGSYERVHGDVLHHVDFNKLNNDPDNLTPLGKQEHMALHVHHLEKTLHRDDVKEKCRLIKRTPEYRERARAKSLEKRGLFSANARKQWEDPKYKAYMGKKYLEFYYSNPDYRKRTLERLNDAQRTYWAQIANRIKQAERVVSFFEQHPERRAELRELARSQWADSQLRTWRSEETKKQWTDDFRAKRKKAYNHTYRRKALALLHEIYEEKGVVDYNEYNRIRSERNDKSLIKYQTICDRFFDGDLQQLEDAVKRYNHKVKSVVHTGEVTDVYDFEVPETHNFALASGVFVHNSAKMGRDRRTQAILPLRGKILNVERARLDKMLASAEVKALVVALGTAIGDVFDLGKLRYHKIIIATDADVDGAHIRTLLLTLFFRHFRAVVDGGFLYIAKPPLYKITKGKDLHYAYTEAGKDKILKELGAYDTGEVEEIGSEEEEAEPAEDTVKATAKKAKVGMQRYKGLGEMNSEELWETTMNPENRVLKQVTVEDAAEADRIFDILMGSDVAPRKSFIQSNAKEATLDI